MCEAGVARPFRFLYMSGANAERDQTKKPWLLGDYSLMRVRYSFPYLFHQSHLSAN